MYVLHMYVQAGKAGQTPEFGVATSAWLLLLGIVCECLGICGSGRQ